MFRQVLKKARCAFAVRWTRTLMYCPMWHNLLWTIKCLICSVDIEKQHVNTNLQFILTDLVRYITEWSITVDYH